MGGGKPFRKIAGQVYVLENDELLTEDDPKGDQKIDKDGVLQGGEVGYSQSAEYLLMLATNSQAANSKRRHSFFPIVIPPDNICLPSRLHGRRDIKTLCTTSDGILSCISSCALRQRKTNSLQLVQFHHTCGLEVLLL
jgi:hypothetical protein